MSESTTETQDLDVADDNTQSLGKGAYVEHAINSDKTKIMIIGNRSSVLCIKNSLKGKAEHAS